MSERYGDDYRLVAEDSMADIGWQLVAEQADEPKVELAVAHLLCYSSTLCSRPRRAT